MREAGRHIRITQSAVSRSMQQLEQYQGSEGPNVQPDIMQTVGNITVRDGVTDKMLKGFSNRQLDLLACLRTALRLPCS
jgi:hypothetical protein